MNLASLPALLLLLLVLAVFSYLRGTLRRQSLLAACSAGFLSTLIPNIESWLALAVFVFSGYAVALMLHRGAGRLGLGIYLLALVLAFTVIRKYDFVVAWMPATLTGQAIAIVGLSYMLFRQIHFLVDVSQHQIERLSLWAYANYQLSFLTLVSGPIQRYDEFNEQWNKLETPHRSTHDVQMAFVRLMIGYLKLTIIAPLFLTLYGTFLHAMTTGPALGAGSAMLKVCGLIYTYPVYLYLNFSGYCDIVIAAGSFLGMRLPENFDKPYLSRNVIDFWTRFHRTLGFWIRDYLFLPLYKWIAERWPRKADSLAFLCYFVAFFLAGIWHGPTANFVVYGLLQAIGVSAAKLWERHLIKKGGRPYFKDYMKSNAIRIVAIVATLHFECFSLLFFPNDIKTVEQIFRSLVNALI